MEPTVSTGEISVRQIKAARALLAWSQADLAKASGISVATIKRLEAQDGADLGRASTAEALVETLRDSGIVFLFDGSAGHGVQLRKAT